MATLLEERTLTARKRHGCNVCLGSIEPGQRYVRQRVVDGRDAWTWKAHDLCDRAYESAARALDLRETEPDYIEDILPRLIQLRATGER